MAETKTTHPAPEPASKASGKSWDEVRSEEQAAKVSAGKVSNEQADAEKIADAARNGDRNEGGVVFDQFHPGGTRDPREKARDDNG